MILNLDYKLTTYFICFFTCIIFLIKQILLLAPFSYKHYFITFTNLFVWHTINFQKRTTLIFFLLLNKTNDIFTCKFQLISFNNPLLDLNDIINKYFSNNIFTPLIYLQHV